MNRLTQILEKKRQRVAAAQRMVSQADLEGMARQARERARPHALAAALNEANRINVIAEFKRRSPSKGVIKSNAEPEIIAAEYERGGAAAISVLTEEDHFAGSLDDLRAVRRSCSLPILRKDFIFDEYQMYESAAAGADALLLIAAMLNDETLRNLRRRTEDELAMDALVEVHTADELRRAIECGAGIIGVNNRDLTTFEVSLQTSIELAAQAPRDAVLISESGIETVDDILRLHAAGYRGFLIGETLMKAGDREVALRRFTARETTKQGAKDTWLR